MAMGGITPERKEKKDETYNILRVLFLFKDGMEKCGYEIDFIQNPVTCNMFVTVNGYREKVEGCGAATSIPEVYKHLQDAFKDAWKRAEHIN